MGDKVVGAVLIALAVVMTAIQIAERYDALPIQIGGTP